MCYKQKCKVVSLNLAHPVVTTRSAVSHTQYNSRHTSVLTILIHDRDQRQERRDQPTVFDAVHVTLGWSKIMGA